MSECIYTCTLATYTKHYIVLYSIIQITIVGLTGSYDINQNFFFGVGGWGINVSIPPTCITKLHHCGE